MLGGEAGAMLMLWIACAIDSAIMQKPYGIFSNINDWLNNPSDPAAFSDLLLNLVLGGFLPKLKGRNKDHGGEHGGAHEEH